jgi:hypothetical protein
MFAVVSHFQTWTAQPCQDYPGKAPDQDHERLVAQVLKAMDAGTLDGHESHANQANPSTQASAEDCTLDPGQQSRVRRFDASETHVSLLSVPV